MNRVVHFEINADQPERAAQFYSRVFGWKIQKWDGPVDYWLASTGEGPGIDGAIKWRSEPTLSIVNTIQVPSVEEFISRVEECGGKVLTPRMTIPGVGYHSYCRDTEGNIFGIMQEDPAAR